MSNFNMSAISIRSAQFTQNKNGIITDAGLTKLDARWKKHRAQHDLDRFGQNQSDEGHAPQSSGTGSECKCSPSAITVRQLSLLFQHLRHL